MEIKLGLPGTKPSKAAVEKMVSLYGNKIYKLAYNMTGSTHDAEEIVQDVFIKLFRSWPTLAPLNISAWIYRVVTNTSLDFLRSRQSRSKKELTLSPESFESFSKQKGQLEPSQVFEQNEFQQRLNEVLDELSPQQRTVLILYDHEGLKGKEIASILNVKEATVRRYLFEAREKIKMLLSAFI